MPAPAAAAGLTAIEKALLGGNILGGLFGGLSGSSAQKAVTKEQARQFNISGALDPTRRLEMLPLRDRLLNVLLKRFGNAPTTYAAAQAGYRPGAGGTGQSKAIYEEMLKRMGYGRALGQVERRPFDIGRFGRFLL
ncbi:MAG: hypothetical protein L0Z53_06760 [Acidobacteriales bacterium]|nr:hypothetical protein [Terriglobales bacterium]